MTQDAFHGVDEVLAVFLAGPDDAGQNRMGLRAGLAAGEWALPMIGQAATFRREG
ncbi:MAG: hypothetical protein HY870_24085 [Chloroflexi bacterium]|nr:hypothetical protein [Chloroflexota bacterium]